MPLRLLSALVLSVVVAAAAPLAPAQAGSVNSCIDRCFGGVGDQPGYTTLRDICVKQCSQPSISYGAIAYDAQSGAAGWAFDFDNSAAADRFALSNCAKHGDGCKVVVSFLNSCGAVASGADDHFATGQALTREQAEAKALAACEANGGGKCKIEAWSCALP
ncbi:MAG: DUF4189 domain-containing protein [Alphaproteobacteria bacterium]